MTAEIAIYIASTVLSLALEYIPGLADWYGALDPARKRLIMLALLALVVGGAFGLSCAGLMAVFACTLAGGYEAIRVFLVAVGVNQGVHLISKR